MTVVLPEVVATNGLLGDKPSIVTPSPPPLFTVLVTESATVIFTASLLFIDVTVLVPLILDAATPPTAADPAITTVSPTFNP